MTSEYMILKTNYDNSIKFLINIIINSLYKKIIICNFL